jgi:hypothetical protein
MRMVTPCLYLLLAIVLAMPGHASAHYAYLDINGDRCTDSQDLISARGESGEPFRLTGDRINHAFQMLLFDCQALAERK